MSTEQIALLLATGLAFLTCVAICAAVALRALAHLNRANQSLYLIARESLTVELPPQPDIHVHVPEPPAPEIHVDLTPDTPDLPAPAEPQPVQLTLDAFGSDPTDGLVPNINVDWAPDLDPESTYTPDPTELPAR